jgi:hypothetical protein
MSEEQNIQEQNSEDQNPKPKSVNEISQEESAELQTTNQKLQTEMEVHKHPHHVTHKKKWGEYLLEFFMLFLAVFLGFIAENIREHYTEKAHTKAYLESYRDELLQQQSLMNKYKKTYQKKVIDCDSIKLIFFNGEENKKLDVLERLLVPGLKLIEIPFSTSSYDQIVNSGALRYITNINLRDSMAAYEGQIESIRNYTTRILQSTVNNTFEISKLEDLHDVISSDTSLSYDVGNHISTMKPFEVLSNEQRRSIVFFYESYIVQAQSNLRQIRNLYVSNQNLLKMVDAQLDK